jgi:hypothetical protein
MRIIPTLQLAALVTAIINDRVASGSLFTAYNITEEVRTTDNAANPGDHANILHDAVRNTVVSMFTNQEMTDYARTSCIIKSNGDEAFVYHPVTADPHTHPEVVAALAEIQRQQTLAYTSQSLPNAGDDTDDASVVTDASGGVVGASSTTMAPTPSASIPGLVQPD